MKYLPFLFFSCFFTSFNQLCAGPLTQLVRRLESRSLDALHTYENMGALFLSKDPDAQPYLTQLTHFTEFFSAHGLTSFSRPGGNVLYASAWIEHMELFWKVYSQIFHEVSENLEIHEEMPDFNPDIWKPWLEHVSSQLDRAALLSIFASMNDIIRVTHFNLDQVNALGSASQYKKLLILRPNQAWVSVPVFELTVDDARWLNESGIFLRSMSKEIQKVALGKSTSSHLQWDSPENRLKFHRYFHGTWSYLFDFRQYELAMDCLTDIRSQFSDLTYEKFVFETPFDDQAGYAPFLIDSCVFFLKEQIRKVEMQYKFAIAQNRTKKPYSLAPMRQLKQFEPLRAKLYRKELKLVPQLFLVKSIKKDKKKSNLIAPILHLTSLEDSHHLEESIQILPDLESILEDPKEDLDVEVDSLEKDWFTWIEQEREESKKKKRMLSLESKGQSVSALTLTGHAKRVWDASFGKNVGSVKNRHFFEFLRVIGGKLLRKRGIETKFTLPCVSFLSENLVNSCSIDPSCTNDTIETRHQIFTIHLAHSGSEGIPPLALKTFLGAAIRSSGLQCASD